MKSHCISIGINVSKSTFKVFLSHIFGTSVNRKAKILKQGDSHLRTLLYIATLSSIRNNPICKEH